jgi:FAD dependent oxidoreductase
MCSSSAQAAIGAATALELSRRGYRTLNVDKLPAAGYGPTSNSCAIVRAHYSSLEGVKMAYEGFSYWRDWSRHVDLEELEELARYVSCGTILLKSATGHHERSWRTITSSVSSSRNGTLTRYGIGCRTSTFPRSGHRVDPQMPPSSLRAELWPERSLPRAPGT